MHRLRGKSTPPLQALTLTVIAAVGLTAAPAARGEEPNLLESRFNVSLGTFLNASKLDIRLDGQTGGGTQLDWGDTFGDDDSTRFRVDGLWRFGKRHYLRFLYTDYSRERTRTFDREIVWGDDKFPVNVAVTGKLGFEVIEAAYEYAFLKRERYEVVGTFGLHYTTFEAGLGATISAPGGSGTAGIGDTAAVDAPLPVVGARGLWRLGRSFYVDAQAQFFALSIDDYDGNITNGRVALTWQPRKYLGIGIGYDYFSLDVDVGKDRFSGAMKWTYSGPQLFFNVGF